MVTDPSRVRGGSTVGGVTVGMNDRAQNGKEARKAAARKEAGGEAAWRGYVNVDLSAAQKEQFDDWASTGVPWEVLEEVCGDGVVVTVKRDKGGTGFIASATQRDQENVNAGLCVTARARTAGKAFMRLLYTLDVVGASGDWTHGQPVADPDRW